MHSILEESKEEQSKNRDVSVTLECIRMEFKPIQEEDASPDRFSSRDNTPLHKKYKNKADPTLEEAAESIQIDNRIIQKDLDEARESDDFVIKRLHEITFERLTEDYLLNLIEDDLQLAKIQLYFFADLCYLMNFDCECSQFSHKTVSNLIYLITSSVKLDSEIKAGLACILNAILRNYNESITKKPNYLRMYEK